METSHVHILESPGRFVDFPASCGSHSILQGTQWCWVKLCLGSNGSGLKLFGFRVLLESKLCLGSGEGLRAFYAPAMSVTGRGQFQKHQLVSGVQSSRKK